VQRRIGTIITAVVVASLAGGGYVASGHAGSLGTWIAGGTDSVGRVNTGTALIAVQPAPAARPRGAASPKAAPSATPSKTPQPTKTATPTASPKRTASPKPTKSTPKPVKTTPSAPKSTVDQLLAQINKLRAQHGLPAYTLLSGLNASAHKHNLKMMGSCGLSHQCPGEASLGDRISAEGVHWTSAGENIGYSGPHPNTTSALISAAEGLTTSMYNEKPPDDGHRLNLLSTSFHHVGIDVVRDSSGTVWLTQDFSN
jgi:uncharacterized protein YkwD